CYKATQPRTTCAPSSANDCRRGGGLPLSQCGNDGLEDEAAILAPQNRLSAALRVRHQRGNVAVEINDAGNVAPRAIGVGLGCELPVWSTVADEDAVACLQRVQRRLVGEVVTLAMGDGNAQYLAGAAEAREGGIGVLNA